MSHHISNRNRRDFLRNLGVSAFAFPFIASLPSLGYAANPELKKQRLLVMFSPNGTIPNEFWPDKFGADFELKSILKPLAPWKDDVLIVKGLSDQIKGDGDSHMRGMSCLLTGTELLPGNIQGGSHTPAGYAGGISIDQEIKQFLQKSPHSKTRFGSLEFGINVSERSDPWTRMVYSGSNRPVAPIDDPYQMFTKLYGKVEDRETLLSVLDIVEEDLKAIRPKISKEDRQKLEEHEAFVRQMEHELKDARNQKIEVHAPDLPVGVKETNDNMPLISKMQIDLIVNSFMNDMNRIATLQFTNSVGNARMTWLGIEDSHHGLSHKPDKEKDAQEKLIKINTWYCEQLAYLVKKLAETKEPNASGSMLDHTTIIWTNELGKGNSHTLDNMPMVMVGKGLGFNMGRALDLKRVPHNRFLMSLAHSFGHHVEAFGNKNFCGAGIITELT